MYPADELSQLARRKDLLRRRIALRRVVTIISGTRVLQPLKLADRVLLEWRRLSPFLKLIAVPAGALLGRGLRRRHEFMSGILRWVPLLLGVWQGIRRSRVTAA